MCVVVLCVGKIGNDKGRDRGKEKEGVDERKIDGAVHSKHWEILTCVCCLFQTQSGSIAMNYIVGGDVFERKVFELSCM